MVIDPLFFSIRGPKLPVASCKHTNTLRNTFSDKVIAYCAMFQCQQVSLFISFLFTFRAVNRNSIDNYRPIALINVYAKILDKIVYDKLSEHFFNHIVDERHGSVPKNCHLKFTNISQWFANNTNFVNAFDKVNHDL